MGFLIRLWPYPEAPPASDSTNSLTCLRGFLSGRGSALWGNGRHHIPAVFDFTIQGFLQSKFSIPEAIERQTVEREGEKQAFIGKSSEGERLAAGYLGNHRGL